MYWSRATNPIDTLKIPHIEESYVDSRPDLPYYYPLLIHTYPIILHTWVQLSQDYQVYLLKDVSYLESSIPILTHHIYKGLPYASDIHLKRPINK